MISPRAKSIAIGLAAVCTLAMLGVLALSLLPEPKKPPTLPFADISALQPGTHLVVDADRLRYFVIHSMNAGMHVVAVPIDNSEVLLPDRFWWKPKRACRDFVLAQENGATSELSRFQCRDAGVPTEWSKRWQWDLYGHNVPQDGAESVDDMYRVKTQQTDNRLVFVGLETN